MKKNKKQKGITLIALILTVIVLLILAVVTIVSIQDDGILAYAENAASGYNQAQKNEADVLNKYEDIITNKINGDEDNSGETNTDGSGTNEDETPTDNEEPSDDDVDPDGWTK